MNYKVSKSKPPSLGISGAGRWAFARLGYHPGSMLDLFSDQIISQVRITQTSRPLPQCCISILPCLLQ